MGRKKAATKKGDVDASRSSNGRAAGGPRQDTPSALRRQMERSRAKAADEESQFSKLSPKDLERMNLVATYTPLQRPIPPHFAVLDPERIEGKAGAARAGSPDAGTFTPTSSSESDADLTLPKKPRWRHDMSIKEVQSNEESVFSNWLQDMDAKLRSTAAPALAKDASPAEPRCLLPGLFERNVQVYRQLWRVTERSDILLVLVDARCPLLHLPPSLENHLRRYSRRKVILVLTKKDIVGDELASAWASYLEDRYSWPVVTTESYMRLDKCEGQGRRSRYTPFLSSGSRSALLDAVRRVHQELLTPPSNVQRDAEALARWEPTCAGNTDWDYLYASDDAAERDAEGNAVNAGDQQTGQSKDTKALLTIGLIGQPNVGKSSLLNALVGSKVVRASRTPGKTKTFQTHRLGPSGAQLCDCPGLVFPSRAGQELQVLGAILPISQVQAVSTVIRFVAAHMPLEEIFSLAFPPNDDMTNVPTEGADTAWTGTRILEAVCRRHGYKTAKAGRWDLNRAGNAILRAVAEGRVPWAFRPPTSRQEGITADAMTGIWLRASASKSAQQPLSVEEEDSDEHEEDGHDGGESKEGDVGTHAEVDPNPVPRVSRNGARRQGESKGRRSGRRKLEEEVTESEVQRVAEDDDAHESGDGEAVDVPVVTKVRSIFDSLNVDAGESDSDDNDDDDDDTVNE
ncbi:unnamed protein product [Parajaminaea phylloscopi]